MRIDFREFGKHLHSQIVLPLIAAGVVIGIAATLIAVYLMGGLTDKWLDHQATAALESLDGRLQASMEELQRAATLISETQGIKAALESGDVGHITGLLAPLRIAVDADCLMVLDDQGRVVSVTGMGSLPRPGDRPLRAEEWSYVALHMDHALFLRVMGKDTLTAFKGLDVQGDQYTFALSRTIDDAFLQQVGTGIPASFSYYDAEHRRVATAVRSDDSAEAPNLAATLREPEGVVAQAVRRAREDAPAWERLKLEGGDFRVVAREIHFPNDPTEGTRHVVAQVSTQLSREAGAYTERLILMWSFVAVGLLVALGSWVARSVSSPLVSLAEGARRVAAGDFAAKVRTRGSNEVAELAETFNSMTESLQERSESLTKKVLELATLYEMSRSLGSTLDLDRLLESVLDSALRIFAVDLGYVTLRDRETGRLELKARRGSGTVRADERAIRSSMSEWVIREGRPLIFNPPPEQGARHQVDSVTGALAALCVPLTGNEGVIGAITVGSHDAAMRFGGEDVRLLSTIANHVSMAIGNIELFSSLQEAYLATVRSLAAAVDAKDSYTRGHSDTVAFYATAMGERLGLSVDQRTALEMAAYLHDIGKIGVREEILLKPGKLTDEEMAQMRHHPLIGANILKPVAFPWSITPVVRHHHERWDGNGYPAGLKGDEIPLLARILTVADSYEAMISDRPYRKGRDVKEALAEVRRCAGTQFDPRIAEVFAEYLEETGSQALPVSPSQAEAEPDEVRAIFVAICDGMFDSFRRLGGPRLAANLETELNAAYRDAGLPFIMSSGHMTVWFDETLTLNAEVSLMSEALASFGQAMERTSGAGLVEHFYSEALMALSERMRLLARQLVLRPAS